MPKAGTTTFQESSLEKALVEALAERLPQAELIARRKISGLTFPCWDPQPGPIDVVARASDAESLYFEIKVDDIGDSIWDLAKLASLLTERQHDRAIVVVAASGSAWQRDDARAGMFEAPHGELTDRAWDMRFLISAYERRWRRALGYRPRPHRLPKTVYLAPLGAWPIETFRGYELRAASVTAFDMDLLLCEGWPLSDPRTVDDDDLREQDVPEANAELGEILLFAVTTDGYRNYGTSERLSRFAAAAYDEWKETSELPSTLHELRSFLFYHQRGDHFGWPIDEAYARASVRKIRALLAERVSRDHS